MLGLYFFGAEVWRTLLLINSPNLDFLVTSSDRLDKDRACMLKTSCNSMWFQKLYAHHHDLQLMFQVFLQIAHIYGGSYMLNIYLLGAIAGSIGHIAYCALLVPWLEVSPFTWELYANFCISKGQEELLCESVRVMQIFLRRNDIDYHDDFLCNSQLSLSMWNRALDTMISTTGTLRMHWFVGLGLSSVSVDLSDILFTPTWHFYDTPLSRFCIIQKVPAKLYQHLGSTWYAQYVL